MESFVGHFVVGFFLILIGVWWTINIFRQFFGSIAGRRHVPYRSQPWYPGPFGARYPIESIVKICGASSATLLEIIAMFWSGHFLLENKNLYHITIYSFFTLNGIMDLLNYKGFPLPEGAEVASGLMALGVEGFLLSGHVKDGRLLLNAKVHSFLVNAVYGIIISIFFEIRYRESVLPSLSRVFFTLVHGTWVIHVGLIVAPPFPGMQPWDMMDHELIMSAPLYFAWHMMAIFVFILLMQAGVWNYMKRRHLLDDVRYKLIATDVNVPT